MKLIINRVKDAISPKRFAIGTHSKIERWKKIRTKGINIPPPPRPPAFERKPIKKRTMIPISSRKVGGKISSFFMKASEPVAV